MKKKNIIFVSALAGLTVVAVVGVFVIGKTINNNSSVSTSSNNVSSSTNSNTSSTSSSFSPSNTSSEISDTTSTSSILIENEEKFTYALNKDSYTITGLVDGIREKDVVIPDNYHGKKVTGISEYAFSKCNFIENITIPNSIESVSKWAFYECNSLKNVYFNGDIEDWCHIAFETTTSTPLYYADNIYFNNQEVTEITIPTSIEAIGSFQFYNFNKLEKVYVHKNVNVIGKYSFYQCSSLKGFEIEDDSSLMTIGYHAFYQCFLLKNFSLGNNSSLKEIQDYAFYECTSLETFSLPEKTKFVRSYSFGACSSLRSFYIPQGLTSMGDAVFSQCDAVIIYSGDDYPASGWSSSWNYADRPVYWNNKLPATTSLNGIWTGFSITDKTKAITIKYISYATLEVTYNNETIALSYSNFNINGETFVFTNGNNSLTLKRNGRIELSVKGTFNNLDINDIFEMYLTTIEELEEKYEVYDKSILKDGSDSKQFNIEQRGYFYEAEKAQLSSGIRIETGHPGASGGATIGYVDNGKYMLFEINSNGETDVEVVVKTAVGTSEGNIEVEDVLSLEYGNNLNELRSMYMSECKIKANKSYIAYSENVVGEIHLTQGLNYIKITSKGGTNYDYMGLVRPYNPDLDKDVLLEKYDTFDKRELIDGSDAMQFDVANRGYFYEAEKAQLSSGIQIENNAGASGGALIGHFEEERTVTYNIEASEETDVLMVLRTAKFGYYTLPANELLKVEFGTNENNLIEVNLEDIVFNFRNNYSLFDENRVGEIHLAEGSNIIKLTSFTSLNLDYMSLVRPYNADTDCTPIKAKYGNYEKKYLIDGSDSNDFSNKKMGYYYEAEKAQLSEGVVVESGHPNTSGGKSIGYFSSGRSMTFTINSNIETDVLLIVSAAVPENSALIKNKLKIEIGTSEEDLQEFNPGEAIMNCRNTYIDYAESVIGEIHLVQGINVIRLTSKGSANYDYISLISPLAVRKD